MSIAPNPTALDYRKHLPVSIVDWVEQDLHRSFADIAQIRIEVKQPPLNNYPAQLGWSALVMPASTRYIFTFSDGDVFKTGDDPLSGVRITTLIDGYRDIIDPHLWLDQYVWQRSTENGYHNYHLSENAYALVAHILKRGDKDPYCLCFARKLVDDTSVSDEVVLMMVQFDCLSTSYTPKQICTAAYQAYYEIRGNEGI